MLRSVDQGSPVRLQILFAVAIALALGGVAATRGGTAAFRAETTARQSAWTILDLGTLGGRNSRAVGINSGGQIVGQSELIPNASGGVSHGFIWDAGKMRDLGDFDAKEPTRAVAIDERGWVAGVAGRHPDDLRSCVLWHDGKITELHIRSCFVDAMNERGQIVAEGGLHSFLWESGRARDLGGLGGVATSAEAINDDGQVIGWAETSERGGYGSLNREHAFLWRNGKMTDLGTLGGKQSRATAINDRGEVVGTADTR